MASNNVTKPVAPIERIFEAEAAAGPSLKRPDEEAKSEQHGVSGGPVASKPRCVKEWRVKCGERAVGIRNPIREIMDSVVGKENPSKQMISLAQGDPTAFKHLRPSNIMVEAVNAAFNAGGFHGYQPSQGLPACRNALAEFFSVAGRKPLTPNDVFMTLGCSEALGHCVAALAAKGANMLLPRPAFSLYEVLCAYHGVECRYYELLPDQGWEVDLDSLAAVADDNTCAVLINNPSNPCGAVYSRAHLAQVLAACADLKLPVIADEVYSGMTFGEPYAACAAVASNVPVISVCALSKKWLAPGWRLGWITVHDAEGALASAGVPDTLLKLCQVSLGPSAPLQAAMPTILNNTGPEWYQEKLQALQRQAKVCVERARGIPGLSIASEPQGAMYVMVRITPNALLGIGDDDVTFARELLREESVAVLPGQCFMLPGYFRVVFAPPVDVLDQAWDRIEAFCQRRAAPDMMGKSI
eukprot:CAMPEP_0172778604 /NCGR_PEP_ID=MMETSP1074-20121228/201995_1 /TAXON_ID=2916 /ORGANISM="Ceratium fusus, Strain PA161109" /LENGTH=469 /DNA_ID=CAMNT_0013615549 /DNA_START=86 /DNA_END=1495 /DNA_ORIENTATION=-